MDSELSIKITAETDAFVKSVNDIKTRCGQVAAQIKEIDKQLKSENADKVAKLAEKLELVQRQANLAAKEGQAYQEQINKLNEISEKNSGLTEEQQRKLENLTEKMKLAEQKAQTYATEVEDLGKELDAEKEAAEKAKEANESLGDGLEDTAKDAKKLADEQEDLADSADKSRSGLKKFFETLKEKVTLDTLKTGLSKAGELFSSLASKALEAAKALASFAKDYANSAVELAAGFADASGYSEQVFGEQAEAVKGWVEDNSLALRIGEADLLDYVNKFGALFTTFGFSAKESAENAEALVELATDLRAATGDDLAQVTQSLTGAMTGSYETLKRYGVVVSSARVEAKAYAMGLVDVEADELAVKEAALKLTDATQKSADTLAKYGEGSVEYQKALLNVEKAEQAYAEATEGKASEISEAAKQTALLAIVQEDLAYADGQAAKEGDSYSSQLALRDTLMQNLKLTIGEKLLPVYTEFQKKVNEFLQSDAGKGVIDAVTEAIGDMAEKVLDFIQSEEFSEWVDNLEDEIPKLTEKIEDWAEKFGELIDGVVEWIESGGPEDLIEDIKGIAEAIEFVLNPLIKVIDAFNNLGDLNELDEAVKKSKDSIHEFADSMGIDYDTMLGHITKFAEENHKKTSEVLNDWQTYEPQVETYIQSLSDEASGMSDSVSGSMDAASSAFTDAVNDMANANTSGVAAVASEVESSASRIQTACYNIGNWLSNIDWLNTPGKSTEGRASGGSVSAGQAYLVGEHGQEIFVPQTNGTILNAGQTERVLNQSTTNDNRSIGAVNVYLTSYGASAEEISEEIGAAIAQKLRLSGAW